MIATPGLETAAGSILLPMLAAAVAVMAAAGSMRMEGPLAAAAGALAVFGLLAGAGRSAGRPAAAGT